MSGYQKEDNETVDLILAINEHFVTKCRVCKYQKQESGFEPSILDYQHCTEHGLFSAMREYI